MRKRIAVIIRLLVWSSLSKPVIASDEGNGNFSQSTTNSAGLGVGVASTWRSRARIYIGQSSSMLEARKICERLTREGYLRQPEAEKILTQFRRYWSQAEFKELLRKLDQNEADDSFSRYMLQLKQTRPGDYIQILRWLRQHNEHPSNWYLSPSAGLDFVQYNLTEDRVDSAAAGSVGLGLRFSPENYPLSGLGDAALAVDLRFSLQQSEDYLNVRLSPMITIANIMSVGYVGSILLPIGEDGSDMYHNGISFGINRPL